MRHLPRRALRLVASPSAPQSRLRVAVATRDTRHANAPFGRAPGFVIYDVTAGSSCLVERIAFDPTFRLSVTANDNIDKCLPRLDARVAALAGCHLLFACAIGECAAARIMAAGIHPLVVTRGEPIAALLGRCQAMLAEKPAPWVRRMMAGPGGGDATTDEPDGPDEPNGAESLETVPIGAKPSAAAAASAMS